MIYGYCRVSTTHQRILRQVNNIKEKFPTAQLVKEFCTGTTQSRPLWEKLLRQLKTGDTIVFDSVSRMSRNAEEGFKDYKQLYEMGINLIFLNELEQLYFEILNNHKVLFLKSVRWLHIPNYWST